MMVTERTRREVVAEYHRQRLAELEEQQRKMDRLYAGAILFSAACCALAWLMGAM